MSQRSTGTTAPAASSMPLPTAWAIVDELLALERVAHYLDQSDPRAAAKIRQHAIAISALILTD